MTTTAAEPVTELVMVTNVERLPTKHGAALDRYSVHVRRVNPADRDLDRFSVSTLDAFSASLCERGRELQVPLALTWRPSKYWDQDLVSVSLPEQEKTA